ncbi:MAG: methylthioribulose 1-phosphate dehydratase [Cyanobacteria bacterium]|nr:methylthioribulose 1-phosphate dehydratase [Cyanobacteriota bacterium]MDA1020507.1 methylthioribulose 1-phosphate dehydratase [Cyanobacteriota bacterium]
MLKTTNLRQEIIEAAGLLAAQGMLPATSGNLSMREAGTSEFTITLSGKSKAKLTEADFIDLNLDETNDQVLKLASAEMELHRQLYRFANKINAVFHTHSVNSVVMSKLYPQEIRLENYELLKAFAGNTTHQCVEIIPVFANTQNIESLARAVDAYMSNNPHIHAYIINGHGLYTWGQTQAETLRHIEALEALFEIELKYKLIEGNSNDSCKNLF